MTPEDQASLEALKRYCFSLVPDTSMIQLGEQWLAKLMAYCPEFYQVQRATLGQKERLLGITLDIRPYLQGWRILSVRPNPEPAEAPWQMAYFDLGVGLLPISIVSRSPDYSEGEQIKYEAKHSDKYKG